MDSQHAKHTEDTGYLVAVGRFTVNWGFAESSLDIANVLLLHQGGSAIEPKLPRALGCKLSFFRKVHEQLARHQPNAARALPHMQMLSDLIEWRHNLVHGMHIGFLTRDAEALILRWRHTPDNIYGDRRATYSRAEINSNSRVVLRAGLGLLDYALEIGKPPGFQETDNSTP